MRRGGFSLLSSAIILFFMTSLSTAQEPAFPGTQVSVVVSAEPRHGKQVPNLTAGDVIVTQEKQRDRVTSLQPLTNSQAGVQLFFLVDDSLSSTDIGSKLNDIRGFIHSQPTSVQVGVAYGRNGTATVMQSLTGDRALAAKALRLPTGDPGASASPYFSLQDLLKKWPASNAAREVIMITDGIDRYWDGQSLDDPYVNTAIEQAQRSGVVVNALYARSEDHFGHTLWRINLGQSLLSELADATGGEAYYLANDSPVTFTPYLNQLSERMKRQYLLTFEAQPGKKPGMQRIKIDTEVPNVELVAPAAVYVGA